MKPPVFSYHDPDNIEEVIDFLGRLENNKLLAGGQSLMAMLNMRYLLPDHLIDLNRVAALDYLREAGGALQVGAMTRQSDLEFSALVRERCPLMSEALPHIGHRQTRNRGTLGGSLCQLDPSAELVTVAAALDATVMIAGARGAREVAFADFPQAVEQHAGFGHGEERAAEFARAFAVRAARFDRAAELVAHHLLAVADAEDRQAAVEQHLRRAGAAFLGHAGGGA